MVKREEFSKQVEEFVLRTNSTVLDSIIHCAESRNLEIESISTLLTPAIKERLEGEAMQLNLLDKRDVIEFK